jgi:Ca2+/Na+ antiporter
MIIINSFRALAVILLASILIIKEIPFKALFKDAMIQFYLALTCMLFLLLVDNIFGFILSICLLSLYFRIYTSELKSKNTSKDTGVASIDSDPRRPQKASTSDASDASDSSDSSESEGNTNSCGCGKKDCDCGDKCEMNMSHINTDKNAQIAELAQQTMSTNDANGMLVPYITEENLLAAQSNIVNPTEYNNELHGVNKGIYNEDVYGSQGLDTKNIHMRGYDTNSVYLGTLSFDII